MGSQVSNQSVIDSILSRTVPVQIAEGTLHLSVPSEDVLKEIRALLKPIIENHETMELGAALEASQELSARCIMATLGVEHDVACRLLASTGFDRGVLAKQARIICGAEVDTSETDQETLDPIS